MCVCFEGKGDLNIFISSYVCFECFRFEGFLFFYRLVVNFFPMLIFHGVVLACFF